MERFYQYCRVCDGTGMDLFRPPQDCRACEGDGGWWYVVEGFGSVKRIVDPPPPPDEEVPPD